MSPKTRTSRRWLGLGLALLLGLTGCTVAPLWRRSAVLRPCMASPGSLPSTAWRAHVREVREPGLPASSGGGATCGCN